MGYCGDSMSVCRNEIPFYVESITYRRTLVGDAL
jgi:hypothetical protein